MNAVKIVLAGIVFGTSAQAGGIDRSGQLLNPLFNEGTYGELRFGYTQPSLDGQDLITGGSIGNVAGNFESPGFGFKMDLTEKWSFSIIGAEDFGADIRYPGLPQASAFGGTTAITNGYSITLLGRYKFDDNWSVYGGPRVNRQDGQIRLNGLAYGPIAGYSVDLDDDIGFGFAIGTAYERKEIGLRVALTYNSRIRHDFDTREALRGIPLGLPTTTNTDMPQSVNLDFQTGIAPDWLVFGSIRWAEFSEFLVDAEVFVDLTGVGLVELDNIFTYTLGVAHQFNENWAGSVGYIYEEPGERVVSPLSPYTGLQGIRVGAQYTYEQIQVSAIVLYTRPGNALPGTGVPERVARGDFRDNSTWTGGLSIGYTF
ncbi:MAG: outer membrane protein transport protein [Rhodobacteraceae bacterium]|nr:outer membrane protein transport protein [Paracoccaceae bacterium]